MHDTQSTQILQKQDERNIYDIMKPSYHEIMTSSYFFSLSWFSVFIYIFDFIFTRCKVLHQHLLFTPDCLSCFLFHQCILFRRSGKKFNDLTYTHIVKAIKKGNSKICLIPRTGKE